MERTTPGGQRPQVNARYELAMIAQLVRADEREMRELHDRECAEGLAARLSDNLVDIIRAVANNLGDPAALTAAVLDELWLHAVDESVLDAPEAL